MAGQPLVIPVGATIKDLERGMREATRLVDKSARDMEERFGRVDLATRFGVGALQGALAAISVEKLVKGFADANKEMARLQDGAKLTGLELGRYQEIRLAAQREGLTGKQADSGIEGLAEKLNEARREENELSKLFDANNLKLKDRKGEVIGVNEAFAYAADLIQNAATEFDKIKIAEAVGLTRAWVPLLENGAAGFDAAARAAREAGGVIDAEVIAKAKEFDAAWTAALASFEANAKSAIGSTINLLSQAVGAADAFAKSLGNSGAAIALNDALRSVFPDSYKEYDAQQARQRMGNFRQSELQSQEGGGPLVVNVRKGKTVIPVKGGGGSKGGGGGKSEEDQAQERLERYIETLMRQNAVLDAEIATFGKSNAEKRAAIELAKAGVDLAKLDEAERQKILASLTREIELSEQKRETLERLKMAQQGVNDAAKYFGNAAVDALEDFIFNGAKAEDVARRLAASLAKAALQALLLGEGPLAGLFGTKAGSGGGVGGLIGSLIGSFGGARAGGGPVSPGRAYLVGEKRPELFVPNSAGRIVPRVPDAVSGGRGASSTSLAYSDQRVINITPAEGVTPAQLTAALAAYDRQARRNILTTVQAASPRY